MRRPRGWISLWAVLFAFWLLLVDTLKAPELAAGAFAAALGVVVSALTARGAGASPRPRLGWLRRVPAALVRLPLDTGVLAAALWRRVGRRRRVRGSFRAVRFRGGGRDGYSVARRAAAKWLDSLGPNSYVVGIDEERDVLLVHQLVPPQEPGSADPMELR
jgi:multisubunit Na+/H+ antiporter MnhE subunit